MGDDNKLPGARNTILEAIGNTPLVKLQRIGRDVPANIYVKCEYLNPGGSMKDRMTLNLVTKSPFCRIVTGQ